MVKKLDVEEIKSSLSEKIIDITNTVINIFTNCTKK